MTDITHIPLDQIAAEELPRDRSQTDEDADHELYLSIMLDGLRQPIEVWQFDEDEGYGLIAGYRRLAAVRRLRQETQDTDRWATIPAFIRTPKKVPEALAQMVAENEIRADISPWDRARFIITTLDRDFFKTADEAIDAVHPRASERKKNRLRATVMAVETFIDQFRDAHELSERRLLRLGTLIRAGLEDVAKAAIQRHRPKTTEQKWQIIAPIIDEAEQVLAGAPRLKRPHNPKRLHHVSKDLHIRREMRKDGWALILTGPKATGVATEQALDEVIRWMVGD